MVARKTATVPTDAAVITDEDDDDDEDDDEDLAGKY